MKAGKIIALVVGCLMAMVSLGLFAASAVLGWAINTQRDDDGYFTTSMHRYETASYAITSEEVDLGTGPGPRWWADRDLASVRVVAEDALEGEVFIGIAPSSAVATYLDGVPHVMVDDVDFRPFRVTYRDVDRQGTAVPTPPAEQDIWVASATGPGEQTLTWSPEAGRWMVVVMAADASQGVSTDLQIGARIEYLPQVAIGLAIGGFVLLLLAALLIVLGARGLGRAGAGGEVAPVAPVPLGAAAVDTGSPVVVHGSLQPDLSRGLWLVKWFLAIPHFIVLAFLWAAYAVLTVIAFFAIVFTGRYPRSIFDFNVGVLRWTWRVGFYATNAIGTDRYPPFSLQPDASYPASIDVAYPERLSRGLVWVKSWLLAIPHLLLIGIFTGGWTVGWWDRDAGFLAGGLVSLLVIIAGVALLFTGRYPTTIFDLVMGLNRWSFRVIAYVSLMTDRYPPFRLDQGGRDPAVTDGADVAATPLTTLPPPTPPTPPSPS